jgi:hypothetical protein
MLNISDVEVLKMMKFDGWFRMVAGRLLSVVLNRIARSRVSVICDGVGWQIGSR